MQLVPLATGVGFVKAGFLGFAGDGKTFTAAELAIFIRKFFAMKGPIGMYDTEAAARYIRPKIQKATGSDLVGPPSQSRSLSEAVEFLKACVEQGVSVAIVDSVTHLWRELCKSFLEQVNKAREGKNLPKRTRMEFQDWSIVKDRWATFADLYLNAPLHVIICGRAGYEFDFEKDEDGKRELVKTGIKMKTEGEFGFEPSLLVQMDRIQVREDGKLTSKFVHRATVLKDRFGVIDGCEFDDPKGEDFKPFIECLSPGQHASVDTTRQTDMGVDESGDAAFAREKRAKQIAVEEVGGKLTVAFPGQSAEEKRAKALVLHRVFGTFAWAAIEAMDSRRLKEGVAAMDEAVKWAAEEVKRESDAKKNAKKGGEA